MRSQRLSNKDFQSNPSVEANRVSGENTMFAAIRRMSSLRMGKKLNVEPVVSVKTKSDDSGKNSHFYKRHQVTTRSV